MPDSPHDDWVRTTLGANPAAYSGGQATAAPGGAPPVAAASPTVPSSQDPHQDPPATTPTSGLYQGAGAAPAGHGGANANVSTQGSPTAPTSGTLAATANYGVASSTGGGTQTNAEILVGTNQQRDTQGNHGGSESVAGHVSVANGPTTASVYATGQVIQGQNPATSQHDVNAAGSLTLGMERQLGGRDGQPTVVLGGSATIGMQRYAAVNDPAGGTAPPVTVNGAALTGAAVNVQFNTGFHAGSTTPTNTVFAEGAVNYAGGRTGAGTAASTLTGTAAIGVSHNFRLDDQGRALTVTAWADVGRQQNTVGNQSSTTTSAGGGVGVGFTF